ncbi:unnamed protein product [Spirodela intermedia]|uniref:Large ribosomal subunit protein uL15/eL18 domain-containing protein n=1 Tax=Spirodela intermedia TaxID=51605 RepID=A0A7I8KVS6_SPIIN|nr:unnamed protein product [Spirodela intermedia]
MAAALLSLSAASPATASPRVPSSQFKVQSFLQLPTLQCSFLSLCPQLPPLHILNFVLTQGNVVRLRPGYLSLFPSSASNQLRLAQRRPVVPFRVSAAASSPAASSSSSTGRFRLDNLGPQPGSRKKGKRKGRGYAAGQGGSCGFGMRGQKSRSGPGVRRGFEGGQMPLYRRIPKLRGIAGGMHAGLPKYVPVNLKDIEAAGFQEGDEVSLESLKAIGLINPSGRERKLPLKILGDGEFSLKLNIKARAFSAAAKEKLEAAGCSLTVLPGRKKWVKPSVAKNLARADEYFAKKRAAAAETEASAAE